MKTVTKRWQEIDGLKAARATFKLQRKIFEASKDGDIVKVHKLQQKLLASFYAKHTAVRQVAERNSGRKTAGPDGMRNPKEKQKTELLRALNISHNPKAPRIKSIPKPGKNEHRDLSIANLNDRCHQALIVLALAPQWEPHFNRRIYAYRKGRSQHDAVTYVINCLNKTGQKYALDADISKFFDNVCQTRLMNELNACESIMQATKKILETGNVHAHNDKVGIPQGGALSPLLANVVMNGIFDRIEEQHKASHKGITPPNIAVYADDLIGLHKSKEVLISTQKTIEDYLKEWGLTLNSDKTSIVNTMKGKAKDLAGFNFLGFHFQHHPSNNLKAGGTRGVKLLCTPSKKAIKRHYEECKAIAYECTLLKKRRTQRKQREAKKGADDVTVMIRKLNAKLQGFANYYRYSNAKNTFDHIDHLIHKMLYKWAKKKFPKKKVTWINQNVFSGVELDKDGKPRLRLDGLPRDRKWAFKSPFVKNSEHHLTLTRLADTQIKDYTPAIGVKSWYDGDWPYWSKRKKGADYPGVPESLSKAALSRQRGKCPRCKEPLSVEGRYLTIRTDGKDQVVHTQCNPSI